MANVRSPGVWFVDTTGSLDIKQIKVKQIIYRSTNATNNAVIKDAVTGATKFDISMDVANKTEKIFRDNDEVLFTGGIDVTTLTAAKLTFIIEEGNK